MGCCEATYPNFTPEESITFSPIQFSSIVAENHPKMFPVIIDDAGLSAFSGDALTSQVKNISKIAQSIRHKNWQVWLNLPELALLAKSVRITNHYYMEPEWIDYNAELCYAKFQKLKSNRFAKDGIQHLNIQLKKKDMNEVTGYYHTVREKLLNHPFPKPSKKNIILYEKMRKEFMNNFRRETADFLKRDKEKKIGKSINKTWEAAQDMRNKIDVYTTERGAPNMGAIMEDYGIGQTAARNAWQMAMRPNKDEASKAVATFKKKDKKRLSALKKNNWKFKE